MKAKAYIESKYRKMDNEERERKEGIFEKLNKFLSLGQAHREDADAQFIRSRTGAYQN
jgi:hypothetical protein